MESDDEKVEKLLDYIVECCFKLFRDVKDAHYAVILIPKDSNTILVLYFTKDDRDRMFTSLGVREGMEGLLYENLHNGSL